MLVDFQVSGKGSDDGKGKKKGGGEKMMTGSKVDGFSCNGDEGTIGRSKRSGKGQIIMEKICVVARSQK